MLHEQIDRDLIDREAWVLRRQMCIPNNRRLFVLACMDERLPVERALGIRCGDAHVFRNAGGVVTDDVIRSAMLSTRFFGTEEIIVVNHTDCGMTTADDAEVCHTLREQRIELDQVQVDPALEDLRLPSGAFARWIRTFTDVDRVCTRQVELLRSSPLIPSHVVIHGYVWEVEAKSLRRPFEKVSEKLIHRSSVMTRD